MFNFIKKTLTKAYEAVTQKLSTLFTTATITPDTLHELKKILLAADTGPGITQQIMTHLSAELKKRPLSGAEIQTILSEYLRSLMPQPATHTTSPLVLIVGVNGSGKTTFIGKLAHLYASSHKKVLIVAGDTFRAAAAEQLAAWAKNSNVTAYRGSDKQDPSSVVFDGCGVFETEHYDHLIIDTAGRLQTKTNLMHELAKIRRVIAKRLPHTPIETWLVLDSMLGQNCIEQAKQFHEATQLTGLVLTKCDGTGKAGFLVNISCQLKLPITYITFGEHIDALAPFNADTFITELLSQDS
jgi:fused signal recognition particle receptor